MMESDATHSPQTQTLALSALVALAIAVLGSSGCRPAASVADPPELLIFAAASLRDALVETGSAFEHLTGIKTVFNFAGSNVLARQLAAAPRADVFVSANSYWLDQVTHSGHVEEATRRPILSNALSVVAPADSDLTIDRLEDLATLPFRHLALGDPAAVPAGIYTRAALETTHLADGTSLWSHVAARVLPAPDARAAVALVAAHPGTLGIVYRTDSQATPGLRTLLTLPAHLTSAIRYEAAAMRASTQKEAAHRFVLFLASDEAGKTFVRHGFLPLPVLPVPVLPEAGSSAQTPDASHE